MGYWIDNPHEPHFEYSVYISNMTLSNMRLSQNSPVFKECEINYVPVFLGGVMKATGNRAPMEIKSQLLQRSIYVHV